MLLSHPEVELVGSQTVLERAMREINELKPDTILVENTKKYPLTDFFRFLEQEVAQLKIIGMNMENNQATLFHRENRSVIHEDELLEIILKPH
jgi:hypothetical protein